MPTILSIPGSATLSLGLAIACTYDPEAKWDGIAHDALNMEPRRGSYVCTNGDTGR